MGSKYKRKFEREWEGEDLHRIRLATKKFKINKKIEDEHHQADKNITNLMRKKLVVHRRRYK